MERVDQKKHNNQSEKVRENRNVQTEQRKSEGQSVDEDGFGSLKKLFGKSKKQRIRQNQGSCSCINLLLLFGAPNGI